MNVGGIQEPRQNGEFTRTEIERILHTAVRDLYRDEPTIDAFTSATHAFTLETTQTEWNLVAHLAPKIARHFRGYSYDVDVLKVNYENRRPDIIIHKRGTNEDNLLVIEVKKNRSAREVRCDAAKIREGWFKGRLRYRFGATINLHGTDNPPDIAVFSNHPRTGFQPD